MQLLNKPTSAHCLNPLISQSNTPHRTIPAHQQQPNNQALNISTNFNQVIQPTSNNEQYSSYYPDSLFFPHGPDPQVVGRHFPSMSYGVSLPSQRATASALTSQLGLSNTTLPLTSLAPTDSEISIPTSAGLPLTSAGPSGSLFTPDGFMKPSEVFSTPKTALVRDVPFTPALPQMSSFSGYFANNSNQMFSPGHVSHNVNASSAFATTSSVPDLLLSPAGISNNMTMPNFVSPSATLFEDAVTTPPNNGVEYSTKQCELFPSLDDISINDFTFHEDYSNSLNNLVVFFDDLERGKSSPSSATTPSDSLFAGFHIDAATGNQDIFPEKKFLSIMTTPSSGTATTLPADSPVQGSIHEIPETPTSVTKKRCRPADDECDEDFSTPNRPFICKICNQGFARKFNLTVHNRIHGKDGGKRFKCPHCPRGFTRKNDLDRHMIRHDKSKGFSCDKCDSRFARVDVLKRHRRAVHHLDD
ncbi:hypothetical protein H4219_001358 [Mycoemilia scoparia]|uniref:C2H2-type domain-containing protein n=1 Tax=Mycoemilia scoparia TaxID=417184 RepID=A0A9W8A0E6_9FUNG|nr:hypothetical protein H4219_001358 [Mycoemilia scoparia]